MQIQIDTSAYFFVFGRYDEKLHRQTCTVYNLIQYKARYEQYYITVYHTFPVMQDKITGRDNDNIAHQDNTSQRNITIFIDNGSNDIRTARTSVGRKRYADTATTE